MSFANLLGPAVLVSGGLTIVGSLRGPRRLVYLFKPLTTLLVIAAALGAADGDGWYRGLVLLGLACSLAGDVFLMLPRDRFVAGLASFLAAHLAYLAAFVLDGGPRLTAWALLPFALAAAGLLRVLLPHLGRLRGPVVVYALALSVMAWQALERWLAVGGSGAGRAAAGAALFVVSDAALGINRFARPFPAAQLVILGTYWAAQWLIATSL